MVQHDGLPVLLSQEREVEREEEGKSAALKAMTQKVPALFSHISWARMESHSCYTYSCKGGRKRCVYSAQSAQIGDFTREKEKNRDLCVSGGDN